MDIKAVPSYWKKSLEFFKKDNLKLYLLLTLNTWVRSIKILAKNFWWLFVIDIVCIWIAPTISNPLVMIINAILLYVTLMTVRPSLEAKSFAYYLAYVPSIWIVLLLGAVAFYLGNVFAFMILPIPLFFFDSNRSCQSFFKACKQSLTMFVCFAPILGAVLIVPILCALLWTFMITVIFSSLLGFFKFTLFRMVIFGLLYLFFDLLVVLNISSMSVLYTKIKHENFNLLFQ